MANIKVNSTIPVFDGQPITFKAPADCSQVSGLIVYYPDGDATASKVFQFADAHGNNVGDLDLFAANAVVKVVLDIEKSMAFVQNADTNAYIERTFVKTINGVSPNSHGNVDINGVTDEVKAELVQEVLAALPVYLGEVELPGGEEQEYLYRLPEATYFDGSSTVIDTGVKLFDTPKDFTIFIDMTVTDEQYTDMKTRTAVLLTASKSADWKTSPLRVLGTYGGWFTVQSWGNKNLLADEDTGGKWEHTWNNINKVALVFVNGVLKFGKYTKYGNNAIERIKPNENNVYMEDNGTLLLGAEFNQTSGVNESYFMGTVNDFRIYNRAMTEDEVLALMPSGYALNGEVE